ncbi:MAG: SMC-Scp complex subunit ScpB [Kiritimatiellia bacterium]|nr:SMC-Scp complex subunit ScpB [Kiritimatiellia bacterium]
MNETERLPELKEIIGAIVFAARDPVTAPQIVAVLHRTAERHGGIARDFAAATEADVQAALEALKIDYLQGRSGVQVVEIAKGFRLENQPSCGPWVREYLEKGRSQRLSQPALETLAIIAYRQPIIRSEIEAVRGVAVDQIVRNLLDLQLIRIAGRSEAPGRPWMFGTTQKFLEHFGLRSLDDLPGVDELRRIDADQAAGSGKAKTLELHLPGESTEPADPAVHPMKDAFISEAEEPDGSDPDSEKVMESGEPGPTA